MNQENKENECITEELRCELIDKYWDINVEHEWWDNVYHDFRVSMQEKGITVDDINFTGFYSQGDGASFTGRIDMCQFLKEHNLEQEYMGATFFAGQGELYADITRNSSRYCHEHSVEATLIEDTYNNFDDETRFAIYTRMEEVLNDEWRELEEEVNQICRSYMQDLYRQLRDEYEALTTKEAIWETIVANELHVLEAV